MCRTASPPRGGLLDPIESFGVDAVGRCTEADKRRLHGREHRSGTASEVLEWLEALGQVASEDVRVEVSPLTSPVRGRLLEDVHHREVEPSRELIDAVAQDDAVPVAITGKQQDGPNIATIREGLDHAQGRRDADAA